MRKTATIPPLRVTQALREEAESVLQEGESLSSFLEESLKASIRLRRIRKAFIERGLASREEARQSGQYIEAGDVLGDIDRMIKNAEK